MEQKAPEGRKQVRRHPVPPLQGLKIGFRPDSLGLTPLSYYTNLTPLTKETRGTLILADLR